MSLTARYWRISNEAERLNATRSPENMTAEITFVGVRRHFAWQNTELQWPPQSEHCATWWPRFRTLQVTFALVRDSKIQEFERFFGCPVECSGRANQFTLSSDILAIPLLAEDLHLLETLRPICEPAEKERKKVQATLPTLGENKLQKMLPHGKANRQRVARAGLNKRTLSEVLAEEDTNFRLYHRSSAAQPRATVRERAANFPRSSWLVGWL